MHKISLFFLFFFLIPELCISICRGSPVIRHRDLCEGTNWGMDRVSERLTAQRSQAVLPRAGTAVRNTYMTRPLVPNCDRYQVATANIALDDCQRLIFRQLGTCFIFQRYREYALANLISAWKMSSIFFSTKLKDRLFHLQKKWLGHSKSHLNLSLDAGLDRDWLCLTDVFSFQYPPKVTVLKNK